MKTFIVCFYQGSWKDVDAKNLDEALEKALAYFKATYPHENDYTIDYVFERDDNCI